MANNNKFNGAKTNAKMDELTAIEKVLGNQAIVIPAKEYQIEELVRKIQEEK